MDNEKITLALNWRKIFKRMDIFMYFVVNVLAMVLYDLVCRSPSQSADYCNPP